MVSLDLNSEFLNPIRPILKKKGKKAPIFTELNECLNDDREKYADRSCFHENNEVILEKKYCIKTDILYAHTQITFNKTVYLDGIMIPESIKALYK